MIIRTPKDYIVPVEFVDSNCFLDCNLNVALNMINKAIEEVKEGRKEKIKAIWLEISGCFGEVISLLNAEEPNLPYMLENYVDMRYWETIQGNEGEMAYKQIIDTLGSEYILLICGAVPTKSDGLFTTIATYNGEKITAMRAVTDIAKNAKHIIAVGTCACYGGPTAARPNLSQALGIGEFLGRKDIINIPGCPANPVWVAGILGYITSTGAPKLDNMGRPLAYYNTTIHDRCPRRSYFDNGIFAKKFGDKECMFRLGCKGPITYAYCPKSRWNNSENWPIEDNTNCIGCAGPGFPDEYEPFVKYEGGNV